MIKVTVKYLMMDTQEELDTTCYIDETSIKTSREQASDYIFANITGHPFSVLDVRLCEELKEEVPTDTVVARHIVFGNGQPGLLKELATRVMSDGFDICAGGPDPDLAYQDYIDFINEAPLPEPPPEEEN